MVKVISRLDGFEVGADFVRFNTFKPLFYFEGVHCEDCFDILVVIILLEEVFEIDFPFSWWR